MKKIIEQCLRVTETDTWGSWAEFTKDVKKVHDAIQAVQQNANKRSKDRKNHGKEDEKKDESKRDCNRAARSLTRNGGGGGSAGGRGNDHRPLVKNHFKSKVWQNVPYYHCTMPPFTEEGATICVYLWWGLSCKWCAEGNCQARSGMAREKRKDAIQAMREEDGTYKEWLKHKDECGGETTTANRKTSKKEKKGQSEAAGMQSRASKMENRMKEAHEEMIDLKKQNQKLRKTLRSKSATTTREPPTTAAPAGCFGRSRCCGVLLWVDPHPGGGLLLGFSPKFIVSNRNVCEICDENTRQQHSPIPPVAFNNWI